MPQDLSIYGQTNAPMQKYSAQDAEELLKSQFLPRLQVCGSQSDCVKEGKINMGVYALVFDKERINDIGKEIDFVVLAFRPKALRIPKDGSNPLSYFNRESPEFKKVQAESGIQNSGCMFGLEFLVYIPNEDEFATLFLGSQSARRESPALLAEMKKNPDGSPRDFYGVAKVTAKISLAKNNKGSWHVPKFFPCNTQLDGEPDPKRLTDEIQKFNNPPESAVEKAESDSQAR